MTTTSETSSITMQTVMCTLSRNWWAFVLRGVLALVIAVLAFIMPAESLLALTLVFGAFSFADGLFGMVAAIRNIRKGERWGWLLFSGILGCATGVVVVVSPFVATLVLAIFLWVSIAFWSVFSGVMEVVSAIRLRKEIKGEIWLILSGLISVALGVVVTWMLLTRPLETFLALGWLLGFYATFFGTMMILLGLRLRRENQTDRAKARDADQPAGT
ncbi:MAG: HdeD family acid-resistance protein [Roseitalea sp.]|uniref:HdeD family acid-resistance protein n=1 Tax=Alphaproteobacteria TaxID=28211 RepID=UPI00111F3901|nr:MULTISPECIES: HdeD family acid-resistance protein [Alphaproteobacteria]MBO6552146.1 HdeD family acid-resistance protein [Roseitalea sp.]MBO6951474.1 HdeD family acid-resistance protein [Rhizobiaceae bacterium]MBC2861920.1 HdeD family acid-resistance protein [Stappia sp. 28M-7]MBO6592680.1 HdeD family acid-resistance protein [Roseitalea sp.]MBO6598935.1 HdeD family acid-resistance protein [Roseitalea sp.]